VSATVQTLTRVHARNLVQWAQDRPEVLVLSGDLTTSCEVDAFRDAYPERFFSLGMAEQNMMSFAGGLAREGFTPFIHTFAVFMYRRALDQISMSIAYPNLRVRMFGFLPGITTPGGVTHQAIDDVGILRILPNMTILETGDATDVESVLDVAQAVDGPVYVRMIRGEIPRLFPAGEPMRFNHARTLGAGSDVTLLSTGICTEEAMRATALLRRRGLSIHHLHVSTLKPFTDPVVLDGLARAKRAVVTLENHTTVGGLGTAVAEVMAGHAVGAPLLRVGIPDTYSHGASQRYLMREVGIDALSLVQRLEAFLAEEFDVGEEDLAAVRLAEFYGEGQQEAL
jgi:transketolase